MTWTLFSSPRSPFVRKVMIAAHELGLQDKLNRVDVVTTPMDPAEQVVPHNPLGMIPTLLVNGEMIFDSLVIMEFFDEQAGGKLFPKEGRRDCMMRHAVANGAMDKATRILDEQFRAQNADTEEHLNGYVAAIKRTIAWMEDRISNERFDAGDIAYCALLAYLDMRFPQYLWVADAPRTEAFMQAQIERPSVANTAFATPPFT